MVDLGATQAGLTSGTRPTLEEINGQLLIPDRPGHGFTIDEAAVSRYSVGHR